jgi:hypothetical protein
MARRRRATDAPPVEATAPPPMEHPRQEIAIMNAETITIGTSDKEVSASTIVR